MLSVAELDDRLAPAGRPRFEAVTHAGTGGEFWHDRVGGVFA